MKTRSVTQTWLPHKPPALTGAIADKAVLGFLSEDVDPLIPYGMAHSPHGVVISQRHVRTGNFSFALLRYDELHYGTEAHTPLEIDNHSSLSLKILRLSMLRTVVSSIPLSPTHLGHYFRRVCLPTIVSSLVALLSFNLIF